MYIGYYEEYDYEDTTINFSKMTRETIDEVLRKHSRYDFMSDDELMKIIETTKRL